MNINLSVKVTEPAVLGNSAGFLYLCPVKFFSFIVSTTTGQCCETSAVRFVSRPGNGPFSAFLFQMVLRIVFRAKVS